MSAYAQGYRDGLAGLLTGNPYPDYSNDNHDYTIGWCDGWDDQDS